MLLDERLVQSLRATHAQLLAEGKLHARAQLDGFYATFRARFGPDRLQSLDGEALLEAMHSHGNRESLVYWLEFKGDDEFPAVFGSIAGGSALKFGLFRRRETGVWVTGGPQSQREITVAAALQIARRHRDQLVKGAELLESLPAAAAEDDYRALQAALDQAAPEVADSAWGHKYWSLLFPDRLDDYHSRSYQQYHLIKLLQVPPGPGRYQMAARFVAIARELDWPLNHLSRTLNEQHKDPYRYWRIGTRSGATGQHFWDLMRAGSYISVGWTELGDLSWVTRDKASKEKLRARIQTLSTNTPQAIGRSTQQYFDFVTKLQERDLVIASDGRAALGIGRVTGGYRYEPGLEFPHCRSVEWLDLEKWETPVPDGLRTTVYEMHLYPENLVAVERRLLGAAPVQPPPGPPVGSIPTLEGLPGRIQAVLERKGQVILYGPPGTGKTYWALRAARDLAAYAAFGMPFGQLADDQRQFVSDEINGAGLVRACTFHPAYGYEDFLEGYRPVSVNGQLAFEKQAGLFKRLCDDAAGDPQRRYYLIIDEINRGDIPRIFGELLTVLEKDKRGQPILLPLSGQPFRVPENVYVIGTMNTADRSIALLDAALRRRFGFVELMPDAGTLGAATVDGLPLRPWLEALNRRLVEHLGRDARNLQIGHAYFLEGGRPVTDLARFIRILQDDVVPLLEEYCYEDYAALARILGGGLVDEAQQRLRHELLDPGRRNDLMQALLLPCPEITTSAQAVTSELEPDGDDQPDDDAPQ